MAEIDQIWTELHDVEERVGRLEADLIRRSARVEDRHARLEDWRWLIAAAISVISCAALVLSLHLF